MVINLFNYKITAKEHMSVKSTVFDNSLLLQVSDFFLLNQQHTDQRAIHF